MATDQELRAAVLCRLGGVALITDDGRHVESPLRRPGLGAGLTLTKLGAFSHIRARKSRCASNFAWATNVRSRLDGLVALVLLDADDVPEKGVE